MWTIWTFALRVLHVALIAGGLVIGFAELGSRLRLDPIGHVRSIAASLQQDTTPEHSRIVYREITGYFPLPPTFVWEVESDVSWPKYKRAVRKNLESDFVVPDAADDRFYGVRHSLGQVHHVQVERVADGPPVRIRSRLVVTRDSFDP
ncbi:MAG: hypothetical protein WD851_06675 [Pirellulales bacterium]